MNPDISSHIAPVERLASRYAEPTEDNIRELVYAFYDRVRADALLGPAFEQKLAGRWDVHLPKMCAFWGSLVLGAAVCYAIAARAAQQRFPGVDPLAVAAGNMIGASLPLIPVAAWNFPTHWPSAAAIGSLLVLGIVCTAIAYILFYRILAAAGSERTVTVTFLIPVFALIWAALFLHGPITWAAIVGCALVLFAVALIFEKVPGFKPKPALAAAKQA